MALNQYFDNYDSVEQQRVYQDLITECVEQFGINIIYIPRTSESTVDHLFGDDPTKAFSGGYQVEVYVENTGGFEGPGNMFSKFGLQINKQINLLLSREAFDREIKAAVGVRPREGDLLWLPKFKILLEITFTDQDKFFYAFGNNQFYGWSMTCEEFRYNNEKITSGVEEVDEKVLTIVTTYACVLAANGSGDFLVGERVYQGANLASANASAEVISWDVPSRTLQLSHITGNIALSNVIGAISSADWIVSSIENQDDTNTLIDNNKEIRDYSGDIIDVTEENSLGNPRV